MFGSKLFVLLFAVHSAAIQAANPGSSTSQVDICTEDHRFRCGNGQVISLVDIECGSGRHLCASSTNDTLRQLCQGQQTCSNVGLRDMFSSYCSMPSGSLKVKYTCLPGTTQSCRTNICANSSDGLRCSPGSAVHVQQMACSNGSGECSWSSYVTMYLCEGSEHCDASGLRTLLPQYCGDPDVTKRNVIVHYYCVPANLMESSCSSTNYRRLDKEFGVIKTPLTSVGTVRTRMLCKWIIDSMLNSKVRITVHQVNSKITLAGCDPGVLNVHYMDCETRDFITRSICYLNTSKVELTSCGDVRITSMVPPGEQSADKFIVSYQKLNPGFTDATPRSLSTCMAPPVIHVPKKSQPPPPTSQPPPQPVAPHTLSSPRPASAIGRNFGPADGMFDFMDSSYQDGSSGKDDASGTEGFSKQPKLLILYIFFGVVILVLVVALVAVVISYQRIAKFKGQRGDSSEKTALWKHQDETPLETFQHNCVADREGSAALTAETTYAFKGSSSTDQVVATVHQEGATSADDYDHRLSTGSGISSFLGGKRDSDFKDLINTLQSGNFPVYSSVGDSIPLNSRDENRISDHYDQIDGGLYDTPVDDGDGNDIYEVIDKDAYRGRRKSKSDQQSHDSRSGEDDHHLVVNHDQQPLVKPQRSPSDDFHYCINNDEYAIVRKSRKEPKPGEKNVSASDQHDIWDKGAENGVSVDFHPTSEPYDKRQSSGDSGSRWSKGERWTDEL